MKTKLGLVGFICVMTTLVAGARNFAELESTYLGDGWFQYRFKTLEDPFFLSVEIGSMGTPFTNLVEYGTAPSHSTNSVETNAVRWDYERGYAQPRPYEKIFLARSSERYFKKSFHALFTMSLYTYELLGNTCGCISQNMVGYATLTNLVPCSAEEADGSPTNFLATIELIPDVKLDGLILTNQEVYGITFSRDSDTTVRLEASDNLSNWVNVAYLYGSAPATTWTTNVPLSSFGSFYRLALLAFDHETNLPPLSGHSVAADPRRDVSASEVRVLQCLPRKDGVEATLETKIGQKYEVTLVGLDGRPFQAQKIVADSQTAKISFTSANLPNPVFVQARAVSN